jgi:ribosomal protein L29
MKDLKKLTDTDLNKKIEEKRKALLDLRFNMSGTGKRNSKEASNMKKEIAKMLTEQKLRSEK